MQILVVLPGAAVYCCEVPVRVKLVAWLAVTCTVVDVYRQQARRTAAIGRQLGVKRER
jgi:hypothetical protein